MFISDEEHEGGKYFFSCIKEGNSVTLSTDDEMERQMWVHKISQATGQSHRPVAPETLEIGTPKTNSLTKLMGGEKFRNLPMIEGFVRKLDWLR